MVQRILYHFPCSVSVYLFTADGDVSPKFHKHDQPTQLTLGCFKKPTNTNCQEQVKFNMLKKAWCPPKLLGNLSIFLFCFFSVFSVFFLQLRLRQKVTHIDLHSPQGWKADNSIAAYSPQKLNEWIPQMACLLDQRKRFFWVSMLFFFGGRRKWN